MRVDDAIDSLSAIRQQLGIVDQTRRFRSLSIGLSGCLALVVPFVFLPELISLPDFLLIWFMVAAASLFFVGVELAARSFNHRSRLNVQWVGELLKKLLPTFAISIGLTWAAISNPALQGLLPPIWGIIYGLGLLACGTLLPKTCLLVVAYYLLGGTVVMQSQSQIGLPMSAQMALLFGIGQVGLCTCLFFGVRGDGRK